MSESVTLKSYFYEVLIPSSQKNTSSPIEDILHHVSISFMKKLALYKCFNPRTHTGCDNKVQNEVKKASEFQSTHPHGVRRVNDTFCAYKEIVSIHAPTRGATGASCLNLAKRLTFQSTHPHGVRHYSIWRYTSWLEFQSTHPHGVRLSSLKEKIEEVRVSIHAPTRGATISLTISI